MMKTTFKKISFLFIFFSFLLAITACSSTPEKQVDEPPSNIGILWEVSKPGTASNYLFGTIHSEDERVTQLAAPITEAFDTADNFVLEMLLDDATTRTVLKALYFSDGRQLKSLLDNKLYTRSTDALEKRGIPETVANKMKPWGIFMILNMPKQETGLFLDAMLYQAAIKQNKVILGLETAQEQTAVFDEMPISSQIALLENTLDNISDMERLLSEVIDIYLRRDLDEILALNEEYEALFDEQLAAEFTQRLVIDRNYRMVERMLPLLEKGNSFVAVGALHLPGEEGVLNLLTQHGFEVHATY